MYYYNDSTFSYPAFWNGREYEHEAEMLALRKLLGTKKFKVVADIGGGYGRLASVLSKHGEQIILVDPAEVQLALVKDFARTPITVRQGDSEQTGLADESCDLVVMVRVMHHLEHPKASVHELWRILKPKGTLLLEFANSTNFKARARNGLAPMPLSPVDIRSEAETVPFLNHHPSTIRKMLYEEGFVIRRELSVSNLRSPLLKKMMPLKLMLAVENVLQTLLYKTGFGPSIFILAEKV